MREWKWVQIFFWLVRTISRDFSYYLLFQSWTKDHIFGLLFLVIQNCCEFGPSCLNLPIKLWSHAHVRIWLEGYWDNYFSPLLKHKNNVVSNFGSFFKRKPSKLSGTFMVFRVSRHWVLMKMALLKITLAIWKILFQAVNRWKGVYSSIKGVFDWYSYINIEIHPRTEQNYNLTQIILYVFCWWNTVKPVKRTPLWNC